MNLFAFYDSSNYRHLRDEIFLCKAVLLFLKMVRAWYMDEEVAFPRKEHHRIPPQFVTLEELYKTSGVEYFQVL